MVKGDMESNILGRAIRYAIERQRMQVAMQSLSLVDDLTGLFNRRGFMTLAHQEMKTAGRVGNPVVIMFCDLDSLKGINDTHGHTAGDQALREVAYILHASFRDSDIIARLGGDEFAIYAMLTADVDEYMLRTRVEQAIEEKNRRGDLPFAISLSIGMVRYQPDGSQTLEDLLEEADRRMYEEKHLHKLRVIAKVSNG